MIKAMKLDEERLREERSQGETKVGTEEQRGQGE